MSTIRPLVAVMALVLVAVGCQGGAASNAPTAVPSASAPATTAPSVAATPVEKATITFWLDDNDLAPVIQKNIVDPFNAQSQSTKVEVEVKANRWDVVRTSLQAGAGPDLIGTPGPSFAMQLARAGFLAPLDDYATTNAWDSTVLPWALELGKVDGSLYSLPAEMETLVLYYNKTLFDANSWTPAKTMSELDALSARIMAAGVVPFAHANAEYKNADEWYITEFLNHVAGPEKVYRALTGGTAWDDPALVAAIDSLTSYQDKGYFMGSLDKYYTVTFAERDAAFSSGKAAMDIEGTWYIGTALQNFGPSSADKNEWDWTPMPSADGTPIYDLGIGGSLSINKASKHPDSAAEFMTYYYTPEAQAAMLRSGFNAAPVTLTAAQLGGVDSRQAAIIQALGDASKSGDYGYTSWTFFPPKTEAMLVDVEKVWAGDMTSAQFLQSLQTQFDSEKQAGELPPIPPR